MEDITQDFEKKKQNLSKKIMDNIKSIEDSSIKSVANKLFSLFNSLSVEDVSKQKTYVKKANDDARKNIKKYIETSTKNNPLLTRKLTKDETLFISVTKHISASMSKLEILGKKFQSEEKRNLIENAVGLGLGGILDNPALGLGIANIRHAPKKLKKGREQWKKKSGAEKGLSGGGAALKGLGAFTESPGMVLAGSKLSEISGSYKQKRENREKFKETANEASSIDKESGFGDLGNSETTSNTETTETGGGSSTSPIIETLNIQTGVLEEIRDLQLRSVEDQEELARDKSLEAKPLENVEDIIPQISDLTPEVEKDDESSGLIDGIKTSLMEAVSSIGIGAIVGTLAAGAAAGLAVADAISAFTTGKSVSNDLARSSGFVKSKEDIESGTDSRSNWNPLKWAGMAIDKTAEGAAGVANWASDTPSAKDLEIREKEQIAGINLKRKERGLTPITSVDDLIKENKEYRKNHSQKEKPKEANAEKNKETINVSSTDNNKTTANEDYINNEIRQEERDSLFIEKEIKKREMQEASSSSVKPLAYNDNAPATNNVDNIVKNTKAASNDTEATRIKQEILNKTENKEIVQPQINNISSVSSGGGSSPKPTVTVLTGDTNSYASRLARSY